VRRIVKDVLLPIAVAVALAFVIQAAVAKPYEIPTESMFPTIKGDDRIIANRLIYRFRDIERGDIIVFDPPPSAVRTCGEAGGGNIPFVKRVIGLPGDRIQVRAGILNINGEELKTVRAGDFVEPKVPRGSPPGLPRCGNEPVPGGGECRKEHWLETLPEGRVHSILNLTGIVGDPNPPRYRTADDTPEFTVPEGYLFFMGDNRDNSVDSRFAEIGVVPFENLIGRAEVIALSADGPFWQIWNWRADRFFKSIE
jgi:signal peptidase I